MSKLLKPLVSSPSPSSYSRRMSIKNCEEVSYDVLEKSIHDWTIPKVPIKEIYKKGSFKLKSEYVIKTVERTESIMGKQENLPLLSQSNLNHLAQKYNYLPIHLVQVVKPLTRLGLPRPLSPKR